MFPMVALTGMVRAMAGRWAILAFEECDQHAKREPDGFLQVKHAAPYGLRRSDQMIAETLVISAARASRRGGSRTSMTRLRAHPLFPIRSLFAIGFFLQPGAAELLPPVSSRLQYLQPPHALMPRTDPYFDIVAECLEAFFELRLADVVELAAGDERQFGL